MTDSKYFVQYSICYWIIKTKDFGLANATLENSYVNILINDYNSTYMYVNNGTTPHSADNQTYITEYTGYNFTFNPTQAVYLVVVAHD